MKNFDLKITLKKWKHAFKDIGSDADKDWKLLLVAGILLLFAIGVVHGKIFYDVQSGKKQGEVLAGGATELIDTRALESVLALYDERAKEFDALSSSTFTFGDPSR